MTFMHHIIIALVALCWLSMGGVCQQQQKLSHDGNLRIQTSSNSTEHWVFPGKCRKLWRDDKLLGRCFGLHIHTEFKQLKDIKSVDRKEDCRSICCNLGNECTSWQYNLNTRECTLGPPVRLGKEGSDTVNWCEPYAPAKWSGKKLVKREKGTCTWGDSLPSQCFGLGPERMSGDGGNLKRIESADECEAACCAKSDCEMYQFQSGRGCYYSPKDGIWCEEHKFVVYDGGRKCTPGFCGGKEKEFGVK